MFFKGILILAVAALASNYVTATTLTQPEPSTWWKRSVYYQIYIRSFKDSNNDGIGDFRGIISKLSYLRDTGVKVICLSSIFKSPENDQDTSDFNSIDPDYGTNRDFADLITEARKRNIKIILDLIPNHTSNKHDWFKKSVAQDDYYKDFYVWHEGILSENGTRLPPNNWMSVFGCSAWEWNEERQQFYLHQFGTNQPDLNYRNIEVIKAMDSVLLNWLDKGVSGFKLNEISFLYEAIDLADEPVVASKRSENKYNSLQHIYTTDQNETYNMVYRWRAIIDQYGFDYDTRILLTEANTTPEKTFLYYGSPDGRRDGAHFSFNFNLVDGLNRNTTAKDLKKIINVWQTEIPKTYTPNWALGNQDYHRLGNRVGKDRIDGFNMLVTFLPGIQIIYYGEEIGMLDGEVLCDEGRDIRATKNCKTFEKLSRDLERTPFQWNNSANAGFNEGHKTWLPVGNLYLRTNLEEQLTRNNSHYSIFQGLMEFRDIFHETTPIVNVLKKNVLEMVRGTNCTEFVFLFNLSHDKATVDILNGENEAYAVLFASDLSKYYQSQQVSKKNVTLVPGEGLILRASCFDENFY